jgi:hypothetical protein
LTGAIIVHAGEVGGTGLAVGETFAGATSGRKGVISAKTATSVTYATSNNDFTDGETCTGATSGTTFVVTTHDTGAHIAYNYDGASVLLHLGTISGQRAIRQTTRYFPYVPGFSQLISMTGTLATPKANLRQSILYGDDLNGIGYVMDGLTMSLLLRTSTSGAAADTLVPQSEWNLDRMLPGYGLNPSGLPLDVTKSQINSIDFQWLGVGRVRLTLNVDGIPVPVHEFRHANRLAGVYMRTPSLPIRYEVENVDTTASASALEQICCSVSSEGGYALPGVEFSAGHTWAQEIAVTTRRPIFAIRLKNENPAGKPNRKQLRFLSLTAFARTNDALLEMVHVHGAEGVTATWSNVDPDQTGGDVAGAEYSADISAITSAQHAHVVSRFRVPSGQAQNGTIATIDASFISNHSHLNQNFESDNSEMFVVYATSRTGDSAVTCDLGFLLSE